MWPFGQNRTKPAVISTDTVIPLHSLDDNFVNRSIVLDLTLRFDDVLDPEKVRNALVALMELGNWRKLGARLRMNTAGKLEYHVPVSYDEERPGFRYMHVRYDMRIENHPLASKLPRASDRPSAQAGSKQFRSLARRPDAPEKLDDYLFSDEPQLSLHIVSFEDSTLLSLTLPHTLSDMMGLAALFNAWTLVLNGKEDQVPHFHGFGADPLATLGSLATEEFELAGRQIRGLGTWLFALLDIFELFWWRREDSRTVCLPASFFQTMRQTVEQELAAQSQDNCKPFISDGDIVCSWWARLALQHLGSGSNRTVAIGNAFGLRRVLAEDLLPAGTAYISNAVFAVYAMLPASEIFHRPLSYVASQIRRSIQGQGTRSQIEASAAFTQKRPDALFGDSTTQMIFFTNWTKAKFYEVDFSSAVTKPGVLLEKRVNALGRPSYFHSSEHFHGLSGRYTVIIFGKDAAGNYWLSGLLRESTWQKIGEDIAAM